VRNYSGKCLPPSTKPSSQSNTSQLSSLTEAYKWDQKANKIQYPSHQAVVENLIDRDSRHQDAGLGGPTLGRGKAKYTIPETEIEFSMNSSQSVYRALDSHKQGYRNMNKKEEV
jgi:hypothetical protein